MIITKANAKQNLEEFIYLSITKANAKTNLQIFICNHFCVDGIRAIPHSARHRATNPYKKVRKSFATIAASIACTKVSPLGLLSRELEQTHCFPFAFQPFFEINLRILCSGIDTSGPSIAINSPQSRLMAVKSSEEQLIS